MTRKKPTKAQAKVPAQTITEVTDQFRERVVLTKFKGARKPVVSMSFIGGVSWAIEQIESGIDIERIKEFLTENNQPWEQTSQQE